MWSGRRQLTKINGTFITVRVCGCCGCGTVGVGQGEVVTSLVPLPLPSQTNIAKES